MSNLFRYLVILTIVFFFLSSFCTAQESTSFFKGFFLSIGMGWRDINANFTGNTDGELAEKGIAINYRIGYALSNDIHLTLDLDKLQYNRHSETKTADGISLLANYYYANIFFLKIGPSIIIIEKEPTGTEDIEGAFGVTFGAGLDLRIFKRFAFTPVYNFYYNSSFAFTSKYHGFALGFTLYLK